MPCPNVAVLRLPRFVLTSLCLSSCGLNAPIRGPSESVSTESVTATHTSGLVGDNGLVLNGLGENGVSLNGVSLNGAGGAISMASWASGCLWMPSRRPFG